MINSQNCGGAICILRVDGDVDFYTSLQLKRDLAQVADRGMRRVIVNLSKVEYMDCAGLGALMSSFKWLREAKGTLALVGLGPRVHRLFEATGTAKTFDIYLTEEAAAKEIAEAAR